MLVKMLTGLSGPEYSLAPGEQRDFPDAEALRLIEARFAVPVVAEKRETATKKTPAKETR